MCKFFFSNPIHTLAHMYLSLTFCLYMYISFCFLPNFVGKYIPYFRQKGESVSIVQNVNRVVLNFLFHNNLAYALSNSGGGNSSSKGKQHKKKSSGKKKSNNKKTKTKQNDLDNLKFVIGYES